MPRAAAGWVQWSVELRLRASLPPPPLSWRDHQYPPRPPSRPTARRARPGRAPLPPRRVATCRASGSRGQRDFPGRSVGTAEVPDPHPPWVTSASLCPSVGCTRSVDPRGLRGGRSPSGRGTPSSSIRALSESRGQGTPISSIRGLSGPPGRPRLGTLISSNRGLSRSHGPPRGQTRQSPAAGEPRS